MTHLIQMQVSIVTEDQCSSVEPEPVEDVRMNTTQFRAEPLEQTCSAFGWAPRPTMRAALES